MAIIAASILDADFSRFGEEVSRVAGARVDAFSVDVMDGHFVPRVTFAEYVVALVRNWIELPVEAHLMVEGPERMIQGICDAGADMIVFHLEATSKHFEIIDHIRRERRCVGIALKKDTPLDSLSDELLSAVDLVNLLSVPIGFGGSPSAPDTLDRIRELRHRAESQHANLAIEVDGGVKPDNAYQYVEAGADMLTVGTGIYHAPDAAAAVLTLRSSTAGQPDLRARERLSDFLEVPSSNPVDDAARRGRLEALRSAQDIPKSSWDPLTSPR
jgi:ribulose-phosphate 3-epimerase